MIRYKYMRHIKNSFNLGWICDSVAFGIKAYMFEIRNGRVWIELLFATRIQCGVMHAVIKHRLAIIPLITF